MTEQLYLIQYYGYSNATMISLESNYVSYGLMFLKTFYHFPTICVILKMSFENHFSIV
jgi:hypothetical protein